VNLIAAEEGDGGADAVDGRAVGEVAFEVEAEALLRAATDGDDDVLRAEAVEQVEQGWIIDGAVAVHRRHVDVVFGDGDSLLCQPREIAFCAGGAGHDPEGVAWPANVGFEEEFAEVFEAGEALDGLRLQPVPDEDHEGGVGENEVGVEERLAVGQVAIEVFECGRRGYDEESSAAHDVDGGFGGVVEEVDAEDAVGCGGRCRHWWIGHAEIIFSQWFLKREAGFRFGLSPGPGGEINATAKAMTNRILTSQRLREWLAIWADTKRWAGRLS
jgi:hypothetical protein